MRIYTITHIAVKYRMRPINRTLYMPVLNRVEMHIINMAGKIIFITHFVFPESPLHRHSQQVLATPFGQRLQVRLGDHSSISHEEAAGELPAAKVFLDTGDRGDVDCVTWKHPVTHREPITGNRHADHDLRCVATAVLAVNSPLGGRRRPSCPPWHCHKSDRPCRLRLPH